MIDLIGIPIEELVNSAEKELEIFDNSPNKEERILAIHNAFALLYRCLDRKTFVKEADITRAKFLTHAYMPNNPDDVSFSLPYFDFAISS